MCDRRYSAAARAPSGDQEERSVALRIKSVEFAGAIADPRGAYPGALPQIAFAGRSNVGKSSLINRVLGRTRTAIARVSSTPGKTQEINFYNVRAERGGGEDTGFFLVDLPGYGYARAPESQRKRWKPLMEWYLGETELLRGVVQLIDIRRGATPDDLQMIEYLSIAAVPTLFVLTKADKLRPAEQQAQLAEVADTLGLDSEQILSVSAHNGTGRDELLESMDSLLHEPLPTEAS